jgi:thiol-disulfide isomerase/thioredoxin
MKKAILTLTACLLITCLAVRAQQVEFTSGESSPGQDVSFTYKPANDLVGAGKVSAIVYAFKGNQKVKASDVDLVHSEGVFKGTFSTTEDTKVLFFKFVSGEKSDFNDKKGYKTKLYTSSGQPVKGGLATLAEIYVGYGRMIGVDVDARKGYEYLHKEFELYPDAKEEHLVLHAALAKDNDDQGAMNEVRARAEILSSKKKATEAELLKVRSVYTRLRDQASAEKIQQRILKEYPKGETAFNEKSGSFYREEDLAAREKLFKQLQPSLTDYLLNNFASRLATQIGISDKAKFEYYSGLIKDKRTLANTYNSIAWRMSGESLEAEATDLDRAAKLSASSLELIKAAMNSDEGKPDYMSNSEWKKNLQGAYGMFADTYALIQYKRGAFADALTYQELFNKYGYPDADANERYVAYMEKVKGKDAALEAMAKFIVEGNSTMAMKEKFKTLLGSFPAAEAADKSLALLEVQAREKLKKDVEKLMIDKDAPQFTLKDLDGKEISMESLRGKTIIIDFWATWCGPCIASFPGMQQAVNKYKDDESVIFLFVNSWESGDQDKKLEVVSKFIQNKGYTFRVPMDLDDKVIGSYGVEGIPTKFVIGPDGRMKFKKIGGGAADKLIEELYIMIDLVKENDAKNQEVSLLTK